MHLIDYVARGGGNISSWCWSRRSRRRDFVVNIEREHMRVEGGRWRCDNDGVGCNGSFESSSSVMSLNGVKGSRIGR